MTTLPNKDLFRLEEKGVIRVHKKLSEEDFRKLKEDLRKLYSGPRSSRSIKILPEGDPAPYEPINPRYF